MSRILAIDFGINHTVIALYDGKGGEAQILRFTDWSEPARAGSDPGSPEDSIPSLIHYREDGSCLIGEQVRSARLMGSPTTLRWMRHYIQNGSPVRIPLPGSSIDYRTAGSDFLLSLLQRVFHEHHLKGSRVVFTVPLDISGKYGEWIGSIAANAGITGYRLIDEATAAVYGYQIPLERDTPVMVIDIGGSMLDVSVVMPGVGVEGANRFCRVLGRGMDDLGGVILDDWIRQWVQNRMDFSIPDPGSLMAGLLLDACRDAREQLSFQSLTMITVEDPATHRIFQSPFSREELEALLTSRGLPTRVQRAIQDALHAAALKGVSEESIRYVLLTGGCSNTPLIQNLCRERFGRDRVLCERPSTAVARGAALCMGGQEYGDYIHHDYGLRFWNSRTGEYDYRIVVRIGTSVPTRAKTAHLFIKGAYDGQTQLGIMVFEMGALIPDGQSRELVPDSEGGYRLVENATDPSVEGRRAVRWVNEHPATLLSASPPAGRGEIRFEIWFEIDGSKRLLLSSRDVRTGRMEMDRVPIAQLT